MSDSAVPGDSEPRETPDSDATQGEHTADDRHGTPTHPLSQEPARHRRVATLIGALFATLISVVFIASFVGALHEPGPRSLPVAVVGSPSQASGVSASLNQARPGGYTVTSYPTAVAARNAVLDRDVDAALVPASAGALLLVATASGQAATTAAVTDIGKVAHAGGVNLAIQNVRPLPPNDPEGISQVFFVVALLAPSLVFGNMLVTKFGREMHPIGQILSLMLYAAIVAAFAVIIADPGIGALTGAPWGLFGIGTLLAFAASATAAAASRWAGGLGYLVIFLLFIPVGIASSGTTLGPHMITPWYADLGRALPAGTALPAIQNTVYFNGNAITTPLLVLSAWALAALIALTLVIVFHPPLPGSRAKSDHHTAGNGVTAEPGAPG